MSVGPRTNLSREQYDELSFDHRKKAEGGSTLHDGDGAEVGRLFHDGTITDALNDGSLAYEGNAFGD